jgi:hypothetical protein
LTALEWANSRLGRGCGTIRRSNHQSQAACAGPVGLSALMLDLRDTSIRVIGVCHIL